jgi:uncharacterized membrane protein
MIALSPTQFKFTGKSIAAKPARIESIDVLRGFVMIIMALDHVRDYFHRDAFLYEPTDLSQTSVLLFFTRFITHYCAPVFVFLAGLSAYLYGAKRTKRQLSYFLFTRGLWMIFTEIFILTLGKSFNPSFPFFNLQVIWAIGISMIILSGLIFLKRSYLLVIGLALICLHNLLDNVHVAGNGAGAFLWSVLHEPKDFRFSHITVSVLYPVLPWIGVMTIGYYFGKFFEPSYKGDRKDLLLVVGIISIAVFLHLRIFNIYGNPTPWTSQKNMMFTLLSLLNVTKYPPSLQYILITLGPAMIFLSRAEKPLTRITEKISVFGRVPFFYYVLHFYLIHFIATIAAQITGYGWHSMVLSGRVNRMPELKGYGFNLFIVYAVWIGLVIMLYPLCRRFDHYKRKYQKEKWWLSYL